MKNCCSYVLSWENECQKESCRNAQNYIHKIYRITRSNKIIRMQIYLSTLSFPVLCMLGSVRKDTIVHPYSHVRYSLEDSSTRARAQLQDNFEPPTCLVSPQAKEHIRRIARASTYPEVRHLRSPSCPCTVCIQYGTK